MAEILLTKSSKYPLTFGFNSGILYYSKVKGDNTMSDSTVKNYDEGEVERLALAFLSLTDIEECKAFFRDLLTSKETVDLSSRLEVARLLMLGVNYIDIAARTGASTATISRVSKSLTGASGGYRTVLARLEAGVEKQSGNTISLDSLSGEEAAAVKTLVSALKIK